MVIYCFIHYKNQHLLFMQMIRFAKLLYKSKFIFLEYIKYPIEISDFLNGYVRSRLNYLNYSTTYPHA